MRGYVNFAHNGLSVNVQLPVYTLIRFYFRSTGTRNLNSISVVHASIVFRLYCHVNLLTRGGYRIYERGGHNILNAAGGSV